MASPVKPWESAALHQVARLPSFGDLHLSVGHTTSCQTTGEEQLWPVQASPVQQGGLHLREPSSWTGQQGAKLGQLSRLQGLIDECHL